MGISMYITNDEHTLEKWNELKVFLEQHRFFVNNSELDTELDFIKYFMVGLPEWNLAPELSLFRARLGIHSSKDQLEAPPKHIIRDGRLNPTGIRYLYLADSMKTAIYETRPWVGSQITTVEFRLCGTESLLLADFCHVESEAKNDYRRVINKLFSLPSSDNKVEDYRITQCIAEYLRLKGYDGVRYDSSVHVGGKNYAIFDPHKVEFHNFEETLMHHKIDALRYGIVPVEP